MERERKRGKECDRNERERLRERKREKTDRWRVLTVS